MKVFSSLVALGSIVGTGLASGGPTRGQPTNPDIVLYLEDWAVYARAFDPSDLEKFTLQRDLPYNRFFINYAFMQINPNTCRLEQLDGWAFNQKESNNQGQFPPSEWDDEKGQVAGLKRIQERYPRVYVMPSIGGWSRSHGFEDCVKPGKREGLIEHIKEVLEFYNWDGIDFDWEYPGCDMSEPCGCQGEDVCTINPNTGAPRDTQNRSSKDDWPVWKDFLREVRKALDELAPKIGKDRLMLSAAVGVGPRVLLGNGSTSPDPTPIDFFCNEDTMDFVNLMTYDFFGPWSTQTGHLAPLFDTPGVDVDDQMNIDFGINYILSKCQYPEKLNLGLATYGKAWRRVPKGDGPVPGLWEQADTGTEYPSIYGTIEKGTFSAFHTIGTLKNDPNCQYTWDDIAKVSTLYCTQLNGETNVFLSYEDGKTWEHKMAYAKEKGLRGAIIWAASDMGNGKTVSNPAPGTWGTIQSPDVSGELWQGLFDGYMGKGTVKINDAGHLGSYQWTSKYKFAKQDSSCPLDGETPPESCTPGSMIPPKNYQQAHQGVVQGNGGVVFGGSNSNGNGNGNGNGNQDTPATPTNPPPAKPTPPPSSDDPIAACKAGITPNDAAWAEYCTSLCDDGALYCPSASSGAEMLSCIVDLVPEYCSQGTGNSSPPAPTKPATPTQPENNQPGNNQPGNDQPGNNQTGSDPVAECKATVKSSTPDWTSSCQGLCDYYYGSGFVGTNSAADLIQYVIANSGYCTK